MQVTKFNFIAKLLCIIMPYVINFYASYLHNNNYYSLYTIVVITGTQAIQLNTMDFVWLHFGQLAIIKNFNFTSNGRITEIKVSLVKNNDDNSGNGDDKNCGDDDNDDYPYFQVWRQLSSNSTIYNKTDEVRLIGQTTRNTSEVQLADQAPTNINKIDVIPNSTVEFQLGDVVGFYHPCHAHYQVKALHTLHQLNCIYGSSAPASVNLLNASAISSINLTSESQVLQLTIGMLKYIFYLPILYNYLM